MRTTSPRDVYRNEWEVGIIRLPQRHQWAQRRGASATDRKGATRATLRHPRGEHDDCHFRHRTAVLQGRNGYRQLPQTAGANLLRGFRHASRHRDELETYATKDTGSKPRNRDCIHRQPSAPPTLRHTPQRPQQGHPAPSGRADSGRRAAVPLFPSVRDCAR